MSVQCSKTVSRVAVHATEVEFSAAFEHLDMEMSKVNTCCNPINISTKTCTADRKSFALQLQGPPGYRDHMVSAAAYRASTGKAIMIGPTGQVLPRSAYSMEAAQLPYKTSAARRRYLHTDDSIGVGRRLQQQTGSLGTDPSNTGECPAGA